MSVRTVFALVLFSLLAACASAEKSFNEASEAEAQGRWETAAQWYIDALRRDSEYPGARAKAQETGNRAIERYLDVIGGLESAGRFERALQEYQKIDRLVDQAASVSVVLATPADYIARRRGTMDKAIEEAFAAADRLATDRRWRDAAAAYRRAESRYDLSPKQRDRARAGRFGALMGAAKTAVDAGRYEDADAVLAEALAVYAAGAAEAKPAVELRESIRNLRYQDMLAAARDEMRVGSYQKAYSIVLSALEVFGPEAEASKEALLLHDEVIEAGTVHVAVYPVWRRERLANRVPAGLLSDVNDILADEHWAETPLFVAMVDSAALRRELRRLEFDREVLSLQRASTVAQSLEGDFAVVLSVVRCEFGAGGGGELRSVARANSEPAEVHFYRTRVLNVRCRFSIIDARSASVLVEGDVDAYATRKAPHAVYHGDEGTLLMTKEQHRWFDRRRLRDADRELERTAAKDLAAGIAQAVYDGILKNLP